MIKFAHVAKILPMRTIASSTSTVYLTPDDLGSVITFTGTAEQPVVLPSAAGAGAGAWVTLYVNGTTNLTVTDAASGNINGSASNTDLATQYETETYLSTGSEWVILNKIAI